MKKLLLNLYFHLNIKTVVLSFLLFLITCSLPAQDKIYLKDSTIVEAKVLEINDVEIKYKRFSNQDGPLYILSKTNVVMIVYENGEKELINAVSNQDIKALVIEIKDSILFIEKMWGVKFENTQEHGGGIKIIKLDSNSIFRPITPIEKICIIEVNYGEKIRVKNISDFTNVLFNAYNHGISRIMLRSYGGDMSVFQVDTRWGGIDISGISKYNVEDTTIKKLNTEESLEAGKTVSRICYSPMLFTSVGFITGTIFGVAGVGLCSFGLPRIKEAPPSAPLNVDAEAWTKGYKSKFTGTILGLTLSSIVGAALVILLAS